MNHALRPQLEKKTTTTMATNAESKRRLFITHVNAIGHYLKIYGQLNPDAMALVRAKMHKILPTCMAIDPTWQLDRHQTFVQSGQMCLYKSVNGAAPADCEFMRVRIIKTIDVVNSGPSHYLRVEVVFIDYGYTKEVRSFELLVPQKPELLQTIPILCTEYILLGICADWNEQKINEIETTIKNQNIEITILYELYQHKFITMKWKDFDFAEYLILQKNIGGGPIRNDLLLDSFKKNEPKQKALTNNINKNVGLSLNNNNNNNNSKYFNANINNNLNNNKNGDLYNYVPLNPVSAMPTENRSVSARLQVAQETPKVPVQVIVSPRMPQSIGNLRNMMQGVPLVNNGHYMPTIPNYYQQQSMTPPVYYTTPNVQPFLVTQSNQDLYNKTHAQNSKQMQNLHNGTAASHSVAMPKSPPRCLAPATFKSDNLVVGQTYDVLVSFVENGPYLFSVQLVSLQNELCQMMTAIEAIEKDLKRVIDKPIRGTACIARYSEDNQLYRALITNVQPTACKVAYIDYGNAELVSYNNLFEIPDRFLEAKAYAKHFSLSGNKSIEPIDDSLKKTFAESVIFKNCKLKVMPLEGPPVVQYCELYNEGQNMLDVLKSVQSKRSVYPKAENLIENDVVEIRYIDSLKRFFVQKVSNIKQFDLLMDEMFTYYNKNQVVPTQLQLGAPCMVKCENDWYRGEIIRDDDTAIIVRHVDFGFEQKVTRNLIAAIAPQHLKMPRQAVQCCLKGFENNEIDKDLTIRQFEMLAEDKNNNNNHKRRIFSVKVFRIEPDGVNLVNLFTKELNVMKKLYKLSMPFEEYVNLEKVDFNMSKKNGKQHQHDGSFKTLSISSASSVPSIKSGNKMNIINSTTLQSDERMQEEMKKQPQMKQQQQQRFTNNKENLVSSTNVYNREACSSNLNIINNQIHQDTQLQQGNKNNKQRQQNKSNSNNSTDANSTTSSLSAGSHNRSQRSNMSTKSSSQGNSPRHNRTQHKKGQQQQHNQYSRPQNAPQGYSLPPHNKPNTNNTPRQQEKNITAAPSSITNGSDSATIKNEEYVALDCTISIKTIAIPSHEEVVLCWWISPYQFYIQLKSRLSEYEQLMQDMQQFYKQKPTQQLQLKIGSYVIARFRKDNVVYRALILSCNQMLRKYKVLCIDTGNHITVTSEDIWQVEKRFAKLPCMAYQCAFDGIVSNYDHLYIIDRMDKYVPEGAAIDCEYFKRHNDVYYVNVNVNKKSLKDSLIAAKLISAVHPDHNLDLLAGQQIRAKISCIKDMLNFKIQFEGCDESIKILCSYDDVRYVKSNSDLTKKFKEFYEGMSCVVNIKSVNDHKVVLLRPLLPLFKPDIRTNICTYPIILQNFKARVVYIATASRLYCQALSTDSEISTLLDEMYEHYEQTGGEALKKIEREQICAALGSDENWYRARIKSTPHKSNDVVEVYYIDYGNTEQLKISNLRQLEEKFIANKSAYAIEVNLPIRTNIDLLHKSKKPHDINNETDVKIIKELENITLEKVILVNALEVRHNHLIADLIVNSNESLVELLKKRALVKSRDLDYMRKVIEREQPNMLEYIEMVDLTLEDEEDLVDKKRQPTKNKTPSSTKINDNEINKKTDFVDEIVNEKTEEKETDKLFNNAASITSEPIEPEADMEQAVLSHCDNPAQFFVHLNERIDELYKLQENLQIVATSLPPLMSVVNGANCISLYSVDKQWYRAKILDAELMVLKFIDFGNTDCVSDPTEVKEMSVFPDIEPFCIPCALPIRPNGTADWVDAANAIFNDSYNKMLYFEYITHGDLEKRSFINLFIDGVNIADKLIQDGFAKPLETVDSGENCFISHVNNISDFYIQYDKNSKALELIECYLADVNNLKQLKKFEREKIVAALFPDDTMWYRAKLIKQLGATGGYEVMFIDYGNTSISPECREISKEIASLPPLSKKCALELPTDCLSWSEAAEAKFAEIAALGETIFTVELREPAADHTIVHLFIDAQNINDQLQPLCDRKIVQPQPDLNISICNTTMATSIYDSGTLYDATVSHVNTPADFYVQFNKDTERLADITASVNALGMDTLLNPKVGQLCAAVYEEDGLLYRARILEILSEQPVSCRVIFIDYGNEAISEDFRVLPQDLLQLKEFCKNCQLENATKFIKIAAETSTGIFNALLQECSSIVKVDILIDEPQPALVKLYTANTDENICEKLNMLLGIDSSIADSMHCLISHATSPKLFYAQLKENSPKMEFIKNLLAKTKANKFDVSIAKEAGQICCVYSDEDDCYYRARIMQATDGSIEVFLIDYGNTLVVKEVHELPKVLLGIPGLALKCKLNLIPTSVTDNVLTEQFAELLESHFGEIYEVINDTVDDEGLHTVQLQVNYKDLAEELAKAVANQNFTKAVMPELHVCSIVYSSSPQSFYVQLSADLTILEDIANQLLNAEKNFPILENREVGALCAALFSDDNVYYRAKITQVLGDGKYEVYYIDFGNNSITEQPRELPESMLNLPAYAKHCSLGNEINMCTAEFVELFQEYIDSKFSETFRVEFLKTNANPQICRIFYQDKNVANEIFDIIKSSNVAEEIDAFHAVNEPNPN